MPAYRYVEENGLAAMLTIKRLAVATPEVNLRECVTHTPLPCVNKATHSGFETRGDIFYSDGFYILHHQKSKIGVPVASQKGLMSSKFFLKIN